MRLMLFKNHKFIRLKPSTLIYSFAHKLREYARQLQVAIRMNEWITFLFIVAFDIF